MWKSVYPLLVGVALQAQAATVDIQVSWTQHPLILMKRQGPLSIGILQVYDEKLPNTPSSSNSPKRLLLEVLKGWLQRQAPEVRVVDYTHLGFQAWSQPKTREEIKANMEWLVADPWRGLPPEVDTSVVTVVNVLRWDTGEPKVKGERSPVTLELFLSSWTHEGHPLGAQWFKVEVDKGVRCESLPAIPLREQDLLVPSEGDVSGASPSARLKVAVRRVVASYYFPFLSHPRKEQITLEDEPNYHGGVEACRQGKYGEALRLFTEYSKRDPEDAGPLYNAAWMQVLAGKDEAALELLTRAKMLKDTPLYQEAWERVRRRVGLMREVPAAPEVSALDLPDEGAPRECYTAEREPDGDERWCRGMLSLDTMARLLALEHPRECGQPGRPCFIERYKIRYSEGHWTTWYRPLLDDFDYKMNFDGTARSTLTYFSTHFHLYEYCRASTRMTNGWTAPLEGN